MKRRQFVQQSVLAGASMATGSAVWSGTSRKAILSGAPFHLSYAIHDGMFRNSAGPDFLDQIRYAYDLGFRAVEDNGMMARPVDQQEKIGSLLAKLGMRMGVFVITTDNWHWKTTLTTGKEEWIEKAVRDCHTAVDVAKRVNATWMTVVPGNYDRSLSVEYQTANVVNALRKCAEVLEPHGLIMVLEALSDNPNLFLRHSDQTYMVCQSVGSPSCKFLFDMYHMQRNEGNIMNNLDRSWEEIGYIQIGDNPGRKEPGTGEMNYHNIFRHIYQKGYKGILGMEHGNSKPGKEGEEALLKAYRESDDFIKEL